MCVCVSLAAPPVMSSLTFTERGPTGQVDSGDSAVYEAVAAQRTGMAVCTVAHTAAGEDELTLAVGDEVQLINKVGDDKFKGRVVGTNTLPLLFPVSCVEVCCYVPPSTAIADQTDSVNAASGENTNSNRRQVR